MPVSAVGAQKPGDPVPPGVRLHESDLLRVPAGQGTHQDGPGAVGAEYQHDRYVSTDPEPMLMISSVIPGLHVTTDCICSIKVLLANEPNSSRITWLSSSWRSRESRTGPARMLRPVPPPRPRPACPRYDRSFCCLLWYLNIVHHWMASSSSRCVRPRLSAAQIVQQGQIMCSTQHHQQGATSASGP